MTSWKIEPCTLVDAPALARNNMTAFWTTDANWKLGWTLQDITLDFLIQEVTKRMPNNLLRNRETLRHFKAVDPETGELVGYARWELPSGYANAPQWADAQIADVSDEERKAIKERSDSAWWHPMDMDGIDDCGPVKRRILSEGTYISLDYLAVHPDRTGKGVATALVAAGIELAKEMGVDLFILSFEAALNIYKRLGFKEIHSAYQDDTKYGGSGYWVTLLTCEIDGDLSGLAKDDVFQAPCQQYAGARHKRTAPPQLTAIDPNKDLDISLMDYLPYPPDSPLPPIIVPYLPGYQLDDGDFRTFPARSFRISSDENSFLFTKAPLREKAALVQEWLFFGLLDKLTDEPVSRASFVRQGHIDGEACDVIDASPVVDLINKLTAQVRDGKCPTAVDELPRRLLEARVVCDNLNYWMYTGSGYEKDMDDQSIAVFLSVAILIELLANYMLLMTGAFAGPPHLSRHHDLYKKLAGFGPRVPKDFRTGLPSSITTSLLVGRHRALPFTTSLLVKRMLSMGWCEHQVLNLDCHDSFMAMYYLSSIRRSETETISHSDCTESACIAYNTSEHTYKTRHVEDGCFCSFAAVDEEKVVELLANGDIPLVSMRQTAHGLELNIVPLTPNVEYTAISHVWIDGLGNTETNALPICQLQRLERDLRMHQHSSQTDGFLSRAFQGKRVFFWMDTLCIPVRQEHKLLRIRAINQMALIYSSAQVTLVLDRELRQFGRDHEPLESLLARSVASKWNGRCWTLQEGLLASRCLFQFKDCVLAVNEQPTIGFSRFFGAVWRNRKNIGRVALMLDEMFRSDYWAIWDDAAEPFPQIILCNVLRHQSGKQCEADTRQLSVSQQRAKASRATVFKHFVSTWNALGKRSTTKMHDIHVILANLTEFKASQIQSIPELQERTKVILQCMGAFPAELMFSPAHRPLAAKNHPDRWVPAAPGPEPLLTTLEYSPVAEPLGELGDVISITEPEKKHRLWGIGFYVVPSDGMVANRIHVKIPFGGETWQCYFDCHIPAEDELPRSASQQCVLLLKLEVVDSHTKTAQGARLLLLDYVGSEGDEDPVPLTQFDCALSGICLLDKQRPDIPESLVSHVQADVLRQVPRVRVVCSGTPDFREKYALRSKHLGQDVIFPIKLRDLFSHLVLCGVSTVSHIAVNYFPKRVSHNLWLRGALMAVSGFCLYRGLRFHWQLDEFFWVWRSTYRDDWEPSKQTKQSHDSWVKRFLGL